MRKVCYHAINLQPVAAIARIGMNQRAAIATTIGIASTISLCWQTEGCKTGSDDGAIPDKFLVRHGGLLSSSLIIRLSELNRDMVPCCRAFTGV